MRMDMVAVVFSFILSVSLMLYYYQQALKNLVCYDVKAWELAERTANALLEGMSIRTSAFIMVELISWNGSRTIYTIGRPNTSPLGRAYTFRILNNGTLMKVVVEVSSDKDYIIVEKESH
ncbi:MAG: hypothetical protein DRN53_01365 [Thermoprotei archaeon]|nr:MAG: hypothetical protein DRN53_01365 [Thermoprotei archaeon]